MLPRKLHKYVAVVAGVLIAGAPVVVIHRGVDAYIERQATEDVRLAAQRAVARAEWRVAQAITALEAIGSSGLRDCADIDADSIRRAMMTTTPLKEISVVDKTGVFRCLQNSGLSQARAFSRELRTADDRVFLTVIKPVELNARALRVTWRRAGDPLQLSAQIPADMFLPDGSSSTAASDPVVRVMLNEGTVIAAPFDSQDGAEEGGSIRARNESLRYPLIATATLPRAVALAGHKDLRDLALFGSGVLALLAIMLALLLPWRARANPIVEMERALEANEFVPYFQPLVDLQTGAIVGAEVLLRWRKPDGTVIPPAAFIPLAESSGLIVEMTQALMRSVRDELGQILGARPRVTIGFNLTADHFSNERIVADVREVFTASPVRFSQIVLEVTERQPLQDLDMARQVIAALQELGCKVAIDDVGTGHGGLSYMLKLGVNCIKIDKMFIDAIGTERYSTTIIETLTAMARSMRMEIFAEGVETLEQVKYLRDRGIYLAQGYVFAPALPGPLFRQLLEVAHPLGAGVGPRGAAHAAVGEFIAARDRVAAA